MKHFYPLIFVVLCTGCIPYKFAPKIKGDHIEVAHKFHRKLSREHAFIFEDTKDAGEFYDYLYYKLQPDPNLHPDDFPYNLPVNFNGQQAFLTFYEVERSTNTLNLIPLFIDGALQANDRETFLEDLYTSRVGRWYIVMILRDAEVNDMLNPQHPFHEEAKAYLSALKKEYFGTGHYPGLLMVKK
ncbi:hypothetical protein [Leeuwenhoekiella nanhaiensis]|uniref:Uncharacterized protein n=1 Tax=Leeuwenhoekiella nanhaiensis TaxID=1655491 RepID=A0A2G1VVX4_9FLAO|nr:hypothetical protein [Leeuwenhoekiella nanhaiensis]PHQ30871.1 hypothetical protein CJ305_01175 [Leeuwenhoekiella nanhaiensis]